jgi:hypothetical protein
MGHRTLSLALVLRALFLDADAYEELRDDDNPFVEGLFLVAVLAIVTALLNLVGQLLHWASVPSLAAIQEVVLRGLQQQDWWPSAANNPAALQSFTDGWNLSWRILPALLGVPDPVRAALNIVIWPFTGVVSWLVYGALAYLFGRLLGGRGSLNQVLGASALSLTPWLFHALLFIPFVVIGGAVATWQLILRYKAVRTAHLLSWGRALAATLLPYLVYLLLWVLAGVFFTPLMAILTALLAGR